MKRGVIVFGLVTAIAGTAWARSSYLSSFNNKYGTSGTRLDDCMLCHVSGSHDRNVYGHAFEVAHDVNNATVQSALTAIEAQDSDNDGAANILEINARTLPGDSKDVPITPVTATGWSDVKCLYR